MDRNKLPPLELPDLDVQPAREITDEVSQIRGWELRSGDLCPKCLRGRLDYDGTLNLSCLECGFTLAGCFT